MPFDFKKYDAKCAQMGPEELQKEWEHYTRLISGAATSTTVSGLAVPFTAGVSVIGVGMAAPAIHNARKKREIIEKHLQSHGTTHQTRKRDVMGSMAFSGTVGVLTLGVGSMGADAIASHGAEHGIGAIVNNETAIKIGLHAALDGAAMAGEEAHHQHIKEKEAKKMIAQAQQKIQQAQAQGEKAHGNQYYPAEPVYGAVQVPGSYLTSGPQNAIPQQTDIKYQTDVKYQIPPEPQYTPAPPPYPGSPTATSITSPTPSIISPLPQYNPQNFAPPPAQTPNPMSPAPSVSTISQYSTQSAQPFSPVSPPAQTPLPQAPTYSAPQPAPAYEPQPAAQNLAPFQSHVAAPGFNPPAPSLVWSHVQNQWIAQESARATNATPQSQPSSVPAQQPVATSQDYGYPFPPQPAVDRRASVYTASPLASPYNNPAAPQTPVSQQSAQVPETPGPPSAQPYTHPPASQASTYYPQPSPAPTPLSNQAPAQAPPPTSYPYPTPAQTPGVSQPAQSAPYFPPPPGSSSVQSTPSYTSAPVQPTAAPQYAPVPTPQPYGASPPNQSSPHPQPQYQQLPIMTPPPETYAGPQSSYYHQYQYPALRHNSLPTPAPTPGQEKLQQGWTDPQYAATSPPPPHHMPHHAATWATPAPSPAAPQQPATQGLCDAYGGMSLR